MSQPSCPCPECCGQHPERRCEHDVSERHTEARALDEALAIAEHAAVKEGLLPEAES